MLFHVNPRIFNGKTSYAYWENFLSNDEINFILALPEWLNKETALIGGGDVDKPDSNIRESHVSWMNVNQNNLHIWNKLSNIVSDVNANFFNFDLTGFYEPAQLTYYDGSKNGHYTWHVDGISGKPGRCPRKLSMVLMLSDPSEFEGGELQIKPHNDEPITLEQKKGRAWFFPSYVLHRVTPVTRGTRRTMVIWIGGPEFR
jgi:PKHD-type hydroxylase